MDNTWIKIIKKRADEIRKENSFSDEPIRDNIFKLIRKKGKLVFYPLENEANLDGFHIDQVIDGQIVPFVFINTAKYWDKCIFCAAHELGHIYQIEKDIEKEIGNNCEIRDEECDEIMNRFAAELLIQEDRINSKIHSFFSKNDIKNITAQDFLSLIIELMDYFFVPYKAIVIRLYEIGIFTDLGKDYFLKYDNAVIETFILKENYIRPRQITKLKQMDGLEDIIRKTQNKISTSKDKIDKLCADFEINIEEKVEEYMVQDAIKKLPDNLYNTGGDE